MKNFLISGILCIQLQAEAQPPVQLYVYSQVFTPGIVPRRETPSENGNSVVNRPSAVIQYYIYAATATPVFILPEKAWIRGQWYKIKRTSIVKTPVKTESPAPVQLVPSLQQKVIHLETGDPEPAIRSPFSSLVKMMREDEFILRFVWKGKVYYRSLSKIIVLDAVHAQ